MCHERFLRRRREQAKESTQLWQDFERTRLIVDPEPPAEPEPEHEPAQAPDELTTAER